MNKLLATLLASALLTGTPGLAAAQEAVTVNGVEATRVTIAPPLSPLAHTIKTGLAAAYAKAPGAKAYAEAQRLYYLYGARHFEPLWLVETADGGAVLSPAADKIVAVFEAAGYEGFRPSDYLTPALDIAAAGSDPAKLASVETAFSAAVLRYAQHAFAGRIQPSAVSPMFDIAARKIDGPALLAKLAASTSPDQVLRDLDPKHPEFLALKAALAKFEEGHAAEPITIPDGPALKPGMRDPRVELLRRRLDVALPAGGDRLLYDDAVVTAITAFQAGLGLEADGITGAATVAALNGGTATSREDIIANMERWRWMPETLGDMNVMVNIPEFRLEIRRGGEEVFTTRVVVGTAKNQTPVFSDNIRHIVVNPYWNVPSSIANNEIAPKLTTNPGYIDSQNMELLYKGQVIHASQVNWSVVQPGQFPFKVRQRPGASNALGAVKFLFPNKHDVYLHDTPSKALFARSMRAYSHGCVRVQDPMAFADALLALEPNLDAAALEAMYGPSERWVNLKTQVPVHLTYFTLRVSEDGTIRSYGDIYGHNQKLKELLGL